MITTSTRSRATRPTAWSVGLLGCLLASLVASIPGAPPAAAAPAQAAPPVATGFYAVGGVDAPVQVPGSSGLVPVGGLEQIVDLSASGTHTLALDADGGVWSMGSQRSGQLGDGGASGPWAPDFVVAPQRVPLPVAARAVDAGPLNSVAVSVDGHVWTWGSSTEREGVVPTLVPGIDDVVSASAAHMTTVALRADGTVWTWGENSYGSLGDGTMNPRSNPAPLPLTDVVAIESDLFRTLALTASGDVWAFGMSNRGEALPGGHCSETCAGWPAKIIDGATAIATADSQSAVVRDDGTLWVWPSADATSQAAYPVLVAGIPPVRAVATSHQATVALTTDGAVWRSGSWPYSDPATSPSFAPLPETVGRGPFTDVAVRLTGFRNESTIQLLGPPVLSIVKQGSGTGAVTATGAALSCPASCTDRDVGVAAGTSVTLTATPTPGSAFLGWSGACSGLGSCTVTLDRSRTVEPRFRTIAPNDLITNGSFDSPAVTAGAPAPWIFRNDLGASLASTYGPPEDRAAATITVPTAAPASPWSVQLRQAGIALKADTTYTFGFWARADGRKTIEARVQANAAPFTSQVVRPIALTTDWTRYEITFIAPVDVADAFVAFNVAGQAGTFTIDRVQATSTNLLASPGALRPGVHWFDPWELTGNPAGWIRNDPRSPKIGKHALMIGVNQASPDTRSVRISQSGIALRPGQRVVVSFWARTEHGSRTIEPWIADTASPTTVLAEPVWIGTAWRYHALVFIVPGDVATEDATVAINVGNSTGRLWIDGLALNVLAG